MRTKAMILGILLLVVAATSFAAAVERPGGQVRQDATQVQIGNQDVITASDAGGGNIINTIGVVVLVLVVFAVIGLLSIF